MSSMNNELSLRSTAPTTSRAHRTRASHVKAIILCALLGAAVVLGAGGLGGAVAARGSSPTVVCNGSGGPTCP